MRYLLTKMISTDDEMFPAQAAASATALREKRGTGAGPRWEEETLREASSLFLDRAWWLVDGWREEGRERGRSERVRRRGVFFFFFSEGEKRERRGG